MFSVSVLDIEEEPILELFCPMAKQLLLPNSLPLEDRSLALA